MCGNCIVLEKFGSCFCSVFFSQWQSKRGSLTIDVEKPNFSTMTTDTLTSITLNTRGSFDTLKPITLDKTSNSYIKLL